MKKAMVVSVVACLFLASSTWAALYDYTAAGMSMADGDWELQKYDVGYWDVYYAETLSDDYSQFAHSYEASTRGNRGAHVWTAPTGEYITKIEFDWLRNLIPTQWTAVIFDLSDGQPLSGTTPILWEQLSGGSGTVSGSDVLEFDETDGITSIGVGFALKTVAYAGWYERFSDIVITTEVPEPATMGLLAVGGLSALLRRKR